MVVNQNFLVCLTGLPASGKTTFANKLKILLEQKFNFFRVKIIDPDKIRENLSPNKFDHIKIYYQYFLLIAQISTNNSYNSFIIIIK